MFARIALFTLLIGSLVACDQITPDVTFDMDSTYSYITVGLDESDAAVIFATVMQDTDIINPTVDLRPDTIFVSGTYVDPQWAVEVPASLTVRIEVVGGELEVEITDVNIEGVEITERAIAEINTDIAEGLRRDALERGEGDGELTEVRITDDELSFTLRLPR